MLFDSVYYFTAKSNLHLAEKRIQLYNFLQKFFS